MPTRPSHAFAFLLGFWLGLWIFLPLAAPPAFSGEAPTARAPGDAPADPELAALEAALAEAVNGYRRQHHKIPLERRADLDRVARGHSADMAARGYFSHETPEGRNWVDRLAAGRVEGFAMAGENVGVTNKPQPNDEILQGWIHSAVHRENLLAAPFNATGVGIARGPNGALYYTQLYLTFAREGAD